MTYGTRPSESTRVELVKRHLNRIGTLTFTVLAAALTARIRFELWKQFPHQCETRELWGEVTMLTKEERFMR